MIIRLIVFIVVINSALFSQEFFDKLYMFGELRKQSAGLSAYNKLEGGILLDTNINIENTAQVSTSLYLKSFNSSVGEDDFIISLRELYVRFNLQNTNVSIGKEIIDLSTSKIYSINTFLSPITFILDPFDRHLNKEGMGVITASPHIPHTNVSFYIYQNQTEDLRAIAHLHDNINGLNTKLFAGFDRLGDFFLSSGFSFLMNSNANLYIEAKHQNDTQNYVIGADYTTSNGIAIALERIVKNKEFSASTIVIENNISKIVTDLDYTDTIGHLTGEHYIGLYARMPYNNVSTNSFLGLYNMIDKSKMIVLQSEYRLLPNATIHAQFTSNIGSSNQISEFGLRPSSVFEVSISMDFI